MRSTAQDETVFAGVLISSIFSYQLNRIDTVGQRSMFDCSTDTVKISVSSVCSVRERTDLRAEGNQG